MSLYIPYYYGIAVNVAMVTILLQVHQRKLERRNKQKKFIATKQEAATKLAKRLAEEKKKFYQQFSETTKK